MVSFLCDTSGVPRDRHGNCTNLPKHRHSWEATFERERARLAACEHERLTRDDRHQAWLQQRHREQEAGRSNGIVITKPKDKARTVTEITKSRLAHHEMGHAILCFKNDLPMARVTIVCDDTANGRVIYPYKTSEKDLEVFAAGRAAELVAYGDCFDAGCSQDDQRIAEMAAELSVTTGEPAEKIEARARKNAFRYLEANEGTLRRAAVRLMVRKTLDFEQIEEAICEASMKEEKASAPTRSPPSSTTRVFTAENCPAGMRSLFTDMQYRTDGVIL